MLSSLKKFSFPISLILSLLISLGVIHVLLLFFGIRSWQPVFEIIQLPFSSVTKFFDVMAAWLPMLLALAAILFSFRAGFWNIGIEGQIIIGAIFTTAIIRAFQNSGYPAILIIFGAVLFGAIGGSLWGFFSAYLKTQSGVHEIVSGIGLNVLALTLSNWLVLGPWKRVGAGSIGGTDLFAGPVWFPQIGNLRISLVTIVLCILVYISVAVFIRRTRLGLQLAAFQINPNAKYIHARFTSATIWQTFAISGAIAGLTGAVLVLGTFHRLIPSVSAGMGYFVILIALMARQHTTWAALIALIFALTNINSSRIAMNYQLAPSLINTFQALWAICMLSIYQIIQKFKRIKEE